MSNVWRFTGPPENWITAISIEKWAFNENNKSLWERSIRPGDIALFHSILRSDYKAKTISSIIGYGLIGDMYIKNDFWWIQEINQQENMWPYVVELKEMYLFSDLGEADLSTPVHEKAQDAVVSEIEVLLSNAIPIPDLDSRAQSIDPKTLSFPVRGSASAVSPIYEDLILKENQDLYKADSARETVGLDKKIDETLDAEISKKPMSEVMSEAKAYRDDGSSHYEPKSGKRARRENRKQKRRVARIENYTCQICGFYYEFTNQSDEKRWICEVDHIIEKSDGGTEALDNLMVLCPNCHAKKTKGAITIDSKTLRIFENSVEIELVSDNHLIPEKQRL